MTFADGSIDKYSYVCLAGLKRFIEQKGDVNHWDAVFTPRECKTVVVVEFPFSYLNQELNGYCPQGYLDMLRSNGFEIDNDFTYKVEVMDGFNDVWWISHICALRYMWEAKRLLQEWEKQVGLHPEWDKWALFCVLHQDTSLYSIGHSLLHYNIYHIPDAKKILAELKAQAKPLEGNAQGINAAWCGADLDIPPPAGLLKQTLEERYQAAVAKARNV